MLTLLAAAALARAARRHAAGSHALASVMRGLLRPQRALQSVPAAPPR